MNALMRRLRHLRNRQQLAGRRPPLPRHAYGQPMHAHRVIAAVRVLADVFFHSAEQPAAALVAQPLAGHHAVRAHLVGLQLSLPDEAVNVVALAQRNLAPALFALVRLAGHRVGLGKHRHMAFAIIEHAHAV